MRVAARSLICTVGAALCGIACNAVALEPGQSPPLRIYSLGDSFTRGANANLPGDNLNNSWVNGYEGFWEKLLGLPDIDSHYQRIGRQFGKRGRRNWTIAKNGASVEDMVAQAAPVPFLGVTYATVMLGANDVCRRHPSELITDAEFEAHVRNGLDALLDGLADGATVLVVAIPNVKGVHDLGRTKSALGITSCERLWKLTGLCEAMLSEHSTDMDRQYLQSRNVGYNDILQRVTNEMISTHPGRFVRYSPSTFQLPSAQDQISDLDCFHAGWRGQRAAAELTWPFPQ